MRSEEREAVMYFIDARIKAGARCSEGGRRSKSTCSKKSRVSF
jgi:hypothetical protein